MKYLHLIASLDRVGGGPPEAVRQIGRVAQQLGHEVELASLDSPGASWVGEITCPVHCLGPSVLDYRYAARCLPWLIKNIGRFDAVVVSGLWQYHGFAAWRALHGSATPYFVFTHGMLDPWFKENYPLKHLKKRLYWPWADYRLLRDARAVFFTSEEERRSASKSFARYRANEVVVNYGTPGPVGDSSVQRERFLDRFPHLRDKRRLLYFSRIHLKKGCDLLIDAFAALKNRDPALHLVLAGPDQNGWQKELMLRANELGIAEHITWTGMLSGDEKWGAFYAAEVFILPSHQENFGIAVAEALACAVPVLITDKVNIWQEIERDGAGYVEVDNLEGITRLLDRWERTSHEEREALSRRSLASFRNRFQIENATRSIMSAIQTRL